MLVVVLMVRDLPDSVCNSTLDGKATSNAVKLLYLAQKD